MFKNFTVAVLKPDLEGRPDFEKIYENIVKKINKAGFHIVFMRRFSMAEKRGEKTIARLFYAKHEGKPYYQKQIEFMESGYCILMALQREDKKSAWEEWRRMIGDTDPQKAKKGTLRNIYGKGLPENAFHGSGSYEEAKEELGIVYEL